jgi:hypothetical protein
MKSKRKALEREICSQVGGLLEKCGYVYSFEEAGGAYVKQTGGVTWRLHMSLSGRVVHYLNDHIWVVYEDLRQVLRSLLQATGAIFDDRFTHVGIHSYVSLYWPNGLSRRPVDYPNTTALAEVFVMALKRAEAEFLIPYLDAGKAAYECTRFYTKWPKNMGAMDSSNCLIAYGVQQNDREKVQMGADRILEKIDHCRMEDERKFALDLRAAALAWLDRNSK